MSSHNASGCLLQTHDDAFPMTVLEAAMMGRHPHLDFWQWESTADLEIAMNALSTMDLGDLTERLTSTLSGGERRRLAIATLLVQEPDILLLDEPMNHLDPLHKLQVLGKLSALAEAGKTVIASLHDPAMAARFARQILLLFGDGEWEFGSNCRHADSRSPRAPLRHAVCLHFRVPGKTFCCRRCSS